MCKTAFERWIPAGNDWLHEIEGVPAPPTQGKQSGAASNIKRLAQSAERNPPKKGKLRPYRRGQNENGALGSITGRDEFIIAEALATALVALEELPPARQPTRNIADMKMLLTASFRRQTFRSLLRQLDGASCQIFARSVRDNAKEGHCRADVHGLGNLKNPRWE
jgi:hypothetical protein